MPDSVTGRRTTAPDVLLGILLAGTSLYLVPVLALSGSLIAAVVAAVLWVGGGVALWILVRRERESAARAVEAERTEASVARTLVEQGAEAYLLLGADGNVRFASPNVGRIVGAGAEVLADEAGLLDLIPQPDRRRVLRALSSLRHHPGASTSLELRLWHADGSESFLDVRATNLTGSGSVEGILISLRDITPRKTFETEIQHLAFYDALTGLANRRFFFEQGTKALALARRHRHPAAVLYIDLDRFKQVNDALGHEQGDALLRLVSEALRRSLRDSDVVARLGGDEFAVILTEVRDVAAAGRVAHRILENMPASMVAEGHEVPVGASIGVAMYPEDGEELEELLKAADESMYGAKTGEAGVQFSRTELHGLVGDQVVLERDMRRALEQHEFHLHYQPVYNVMTGEMAGAEALSRWRHLTRGLVAASEFIRLAERAGLIRSLDRWAIARALHQRSTLLEDGWRGWVAVNLSPYSVTDPDLPRYIREALEAEGVEPGALVLELPEAAVFEDIDAAADLMWELKNTGAAIALDDYGAGSTSFAHLRRLPLDILKLDSAFIRGIGADGAEEGMLGGAISIAHGIRAKVLAKGVERVEQVEWLREAGCDFLQGYFVGAPGPPEDLTGEGGRTGRPEAAR